MTKTSPAGDDLAAVPGHDPGRPEYVGASKISVFGRGPTHPIGCQRHMPDLGLCRAHSGRMEDQSAVGRGARHAPCCPFRLGPLHQDHGGCFAWILTDPQTLTKPLPLTRSHGSVNWAKLPRELQNQLQNQLQHAAVRRLAEADVLAEMQQAKADLLTTCPQELPATRKTGCTQGRTGPIWLWFPKFLKGCFLLKPVFWLFELAIICGKL